MQPLFKELSIDGRFEDCAIRLQERKETPRVAHAVYVDEVLVLPMVAQVHASFVKAVISEERSDAARIIE